MSLLQVLPFIPSSIHTKNRRRACSECPFMVKILGGEMGGRWCGTPLIGGEVTGSSGVSIQLCGCNTKYKAKVDEEVCPDNRWEKK